MKHIFTQLATLLLLVFTAQAQSASWQWGKRGGSMGSGGTEKVIDMATDGKGNVYVLAVNNPGIANVDGHTGIGTHDRISIVSWDCDRNFRWMKTLGGGLSFTGKALRTDTLGGVYMAGGLINQTSLAGMAYFDTDTTLPYNYKSMYLVKYDTAGVFQWVKQPQPDTFSVNMGDNGIFGIYDMDVSSIGDIYLYSYLSPGGYDKGDYTVSTKGYYITTYDASGGYKSLISLDVMTTNGGDPSKVDGQYNAAQANLCHDNYNDRFYLAGSYSSEYGDMSFGTTTFSGIDYVPMMYIGAFDHAGNSLWVKQGRNDKVAVIPSRPALDNTGNIFIGGTTVPGNSFGGYTFNNKLGAHMIQFAIAIDSNGNNIWANNSSAKDGAVNIGGIVHNKGTIGISGMYGGLLEWGGDTITAPLVSTGLVYLLLVRINAVTGTIIALDSIESNSLNNISTAILSDQKNNFYLGGYFAEQLYIADDTLTKLTIGSNDWFVAKFGSDNCNCTILVPAFTYTVASGSTFNFTYSGTTPYTSINWDFGDGSPGSTAGSPAHAYTIAGSYIVCVTVANDCGSNSYCKTVNTTGTAINEIPDFVNVNIFPNPVTQNINIENVTVGTILEICSITGRSVLQKILYGVRASIDVSDLVSGIYIIRLTDLDGNQGVFRFAKQ